MTSQLNKPCIVCGRPAAPHGEHHAVPRGGDDGATGPKGMGGSSKNHEDERIVLCRGCHQDVHDSVVKIRRRGDRFIIERGGVVAIRAQDEKPVRPLATKATSVQSLIDAIPAATDESLCNLWAWSDDQRMTATMLQCLAAAELRQRYVSFGEDAWHKRVSEMIRDSTGRTVAVGTVYNYANIGIALAGFDDKLEVFLRLGMSLTAAAGRAITKGAEPKEIIEYIESGKAEGRKPSEIRREVRETFSGDDTTPKCEALGHHVCRHCGAELEDE